MKKKIVVLVVVLVGALSLFSACDLFPFRSEQPFSAINYICEEELCADTSHAHNNCFDGDCHIIADHLHEGQHCTLNGCNQANSHTHCDINNCAQTGIHQHENCDQSHNHNGCRENNRHHGNGNHCR